MPALIFDYDGLIIDSETTAAQVVIELFAEHDVSVSLKDMTRFFGTSGPGNQRAWEHWIGGLLGPGSDVSAFDELAWERTRFLLESLPVRPGVRELIQSARKSDWKIGLATGHTYDPLIEDLTRLEILDDMDEIVTSAEVTNPKPAPDIFVETARRLDVPAEQCLVLEDSLPGCQAAQAAGMQVVVCPCGVTEFSDFPPEIRKVGSLLEVDLATIDLTGD